MDGTVIGILIWVGIGMFWSLWLISDVQKRIIKPMSNARRMVVMTINLIAWPLALVVAFWKVFFRGTYVGETEEN